MWKSNKLPLQLKLRLLDALIMSVLLYGSETWIVTKTMSDKINAFGTSCYRILLGIKRTDRVRNSVVLQAVNRKDLCCTVHRRQLKTLVDWLCKEDSVVQRYALYLPSHGRNRRGRPRLTYARYMENTTGLSSDEIKSLAADRDRWRSTVVGRYDPRPPD